MGKKYRNRVLAAWVLLIALMPVYIVKAVHFHDAKDSVACHSQSAGHSQNSSDACPICHFFLSPFTETTPAHIAFFALLMAILPVLPVVRIAKVQMVRASLRAPPVRFRLYIYFVFVNALYGRVVLLRIL